jgi:hypothetical protein
MNNLIYGINPLVISRIIDKKGKRIGRSHPYKTLLKRRKYPILDKLGFFEDDDWGYFRQAQVVILGADGDTIGIISCNSNDNADKLRNELISELNEKLALYQGAVKHESKS